MTVPRNVSTRFAERLMPHNAALVLVDCQTRAIDGGVCGEGLVNSLMGLARLAFAHGLPTVLGATGDRNNGEVLPELLQLFGTGTMVRRKSGPFWADARSRAAVAATGRRALVVAACGRGEGLAGVALSAVSEGYAVHAVLDASTAGERVATARMNAGGVHLTSWVALLAEFAAHREDRGATAAVRENLARYTAGTGSWPDGLIDPVRGLPL